MPIAERSVSHPLSDESPRAKSDPTVNDRSNYLYLMCSADDITEFWADSYGRSAENYAKLFAGEIFKQHGIEALYNRIEEEITSNGASVLVIEISAPIFDPFVILALKQKYDLMVVLLAIDDEFKFDWISSTYATVADLVLTTDYVSVNRYRQSGINAHFFCLPAYVPSEVPVRTTEDPEYGVSFVGRVTADKPSRTRMMSFLAKEVEVSFFGSSGPDDPAYLSRDDMYSVFRNSVINLNFSGMTTYLNSDNALFERIRTMKLRPLEIAAAGGFCISEFSISLAECLKDGVDIVFFRSKEELLEKIRYYLSHKDEARRIGQTGAEKVREQFSGEAMARKLASLVQESQGQMGVDLYGEPHRIKVSREFASTFMLVTLSNAVHLLVRGKLRSFVRDVRRCVDFLGRFSAGAGRTAGLQVAAVASYRLLKFLLATVRAALMHVLRNRPLGTGN